MHWQLTLCSRHTMNSRWWWWWCIADVNACTAMIMLYCMFHYKCILSFLQFDSTVDCCFIFVRGVKLHGLCRLQYWWWCNGHLMHVDDAVILFSDEAHEWHGWQTVTLESSRWRCFASASAGNWFSQVRLSSIFGVFRVPTCLWKSLKVLEFKSCKFIALTVLENIGGLWKSLKSPRMCVIRFGEFLLGNVKCMPPVGFFGI